MTSEEATVLIDSVKVMTGVMIEALEEIKQIKTRMEFQTALQSTIASSLRDENTTVAEFLADISASSGLTAECETEMRDFFAISDPETAFSGPIGTDETPPEREVDEEVEVRHYGDLEDLTQSMDSDGLPVDPKELEDAAGIY